MTLWETLKSSVPFGADRVTSPVKVSQPREVFTYTPSLWDRIFTSGPAQAVEKALTPAAAVIEKTGGVAGTIGAVNSGLRWGLILAGALLAIFIYREFKILKG
jgi:hypothetical protein